MSYITSLLSADHDKAHFSCGNDMLDNYLHKQAKQDIKRRLSACFIFADNKTVKGYYTLSSSSIHRSLLPADVLKKLPPSYTDLPVTLLGRLAVDNRFKAQGIGKLLLIDALRRSYEVSISNIASMAVIVDPIDEEATNFYLKFGFNLLSGSMRMFIMMATVEQLF